MNTSTRLLFFTIFLSMYSFGAASEEVPKRSQKILDGFKSKKTLVYKTVGEEPLDIMLFLPSGEQAAPMPVAIYTHGGGWGKGDKYKILQRPFLDALKQLLDRGIAVASIEYRLTRPGVSNAIDCVVDCKDAARFLSQHADEFKLDAKRMAVWGGSAGGHLALMTGLAQNKLFPGDQSLKAEDPHFLAIAAYYPATTFEHPELLKGSNFERPQRMVPMIGGLAKDHPDRVKLLSPTRHLTADSPPILLIHGDQDSVLPIALSKHFMDTARRKSARAKLLTVRGGEHGFRGENIQPGIKQINDRVAGFLINHLLSNL